MAGRDLTQRQFEHALETLGVTHDGDAWDHGNYRLPRGKMPVQGLFGHPQLDISSRRALLADLRRRVESDREAACVREAVRALRRGDRIQRPTFGGELQRAIVVRPYDPDAPREERGIGVIWRGRRAWWQPEHCTPQRGRWSGPGDLLAALRSERERIVVELAEVETEIEREIGGAS